MKKLKLNTTKLQLKKSTVVGLTSVEMGQIRGGDTGPCTTYPCETIISQWQCEPTNTQTHYCASDACPSYYCEPTTMTLWTPNNGPGCGTW